MSSLFAYVHVRIGGHKYYIGEAAIVYRQTPSVAPPIQNPDCTLAMLGKELITTPVCARGRSCMRRSLPSECVRASDSHRSGT
jgi:hypothetical protein